MNATECKCVECGKQAEVFWPCIDIDVPSHPYCRKCVTIQQLKCLEGMENLKFKNN